MKRLRRWFGSLTVVHLLAFSAIIQIMAGNSQAGAIYFVAAGCFEIAEKLKR